ncbi:Flp family type IVb pilin [Hyphomonas sp.]|uniref:Flp family type IVb pilin n=1 Tax=Hyphomonas sp. TaxID=87 RepID=UPI003919A2DE
MAKKSSLLSRFLRDERGATAVEYGLIVALMVVALLAALTNVADGNAEMYRHIEDAVTSV